MLLKKKQHALIMKVIEAWQREELINGDLTVKLKESIGILRFDWKRLARYSFWIAAISLAISIFTLVLDDVIFEILKNLFRMPPLFKSIIMAFCSAAFYVWGFVRRQKKPDKYFTNESLLFIGAILTGAALAFFGAAVNTGSGHFSILILFAVLVYLGIGITFPSTLMWVIGLISFGTWLGTETGYLSGWGAYFLGMNYPLRFVLLGVILAAGSFPLQKSRFNHVAGSTSAMGYLYLFISLWLMSIFGNYGDITSWHNASVTELLIWSLVFGLAALAAIVVGLKNDDSIARKFGITFLFINLYTKYFEYFWDVAHKAVFFAILAISFWLVGRYSERVYNLLKCRIKDFKD
ncbi:MAG: DUF2157 domain-containing protein [Spirochaetes bacterium]|nr:DUF2157 domain-containing protein [Spirochaetota bacterium]MBN2771844.1 DUF2157 domain-containing protein [Spirochaetota bacterium]